MSEFRELSELPDDPEYWAALERRVLAGLPATVPAGSSASAVATGWWRPLETGAPGLFATALVALLVALLLLPPRRTAGIGMLLVPADPAGASLIASPEPPALASLLFPPRAQPTR